MSNDENANKFAEALQTIESTRDPAALVALFTSDASLESIAMQQPIRGIDAIAEFWQEYLAFFDKLETTFSSIVATDAISVLEWFSKGVLAGGGDIDYRGVSLLQFKGDQVAVFRTYYDSAAFVPKLAEHVKRNS